MKQFHQLSQRTNGKIRFQKQTFNKDFLEISGRPITYVSGKESWLMYRNKASKSGSIS
jgi:hypothetical protein